MDGIPPLTMYQVVTVDDSDLPDSHDWALVELPDRTLLIINANADPGQIGPDAWAAYRLVAEGRHCSRRVLRAVG